MNKEQFGYFSIHLSLPRSVKGTHHITHTHRKNETADDARLYQQIIRKEVVIQPNRP